MLTGIFMASVSALAWSILDISRKRLAEGISASAAVAGLTLFQLPILFGLMLAGEGIDAPTGVAAIFLTGFPGPLPAAYWPWAAGTVAINLIANLLFFRAVQISPLSLTIPYLSFTPVFSAIVAYFALNEAPTWSSAAGITVVCIGAFLMNRGDAESGLFAPLTALKNERGSLYMIGVAALWGLSPVVDKIGSQESSVVWQTTVLTGGVAIAFVAYHAFRDSSLRPLFSALRPHSRLLIWCAVFNVVAMLVQIGAYTFIDVAYVETIKRIIGVVGAMAAGVLLFGETDIARRLLGAAVMVVGVALILF